MTPEQFVYCLSGYLSDKEYEVDSAVLKEALKKVKALSKLFKHKIAPPRRGYLFPTNFYLSHITSVLL